MKEGEEPQVPKSDTEALEVLRRKFRRKASVLDSSSHRWRASVAWQRGAQQLRQATAGPGAAVRALGVSGSCLWLRAFRL